MYNGSYQHKLNLAAARSLIPKISCQYCSHIYVKGNIVKHEASCWLNPINFKACVVCGKGIKNYKTNTTCGYSCANKHFRTGPNAGNWKEDCYRSTCFYYHKKECVVCGEQNIIEVHHLDEDRTNNKPDNLIPLCPTHHQYWHSRFKYLVEDKICQYLIRWSTDNQ